jgi:hypothetical protein
MSGAHRQVPLRCGPEVALLLCRVLRWYTEDRFPPRRVPGCDLVAREALQGARQGLERQLHDDPRRLSISRRARPLYRDAVRGWCDMVERLEGRDAGAERGALLAALAGHPVPDACLRPGPEAAAVAARPPEGP